MVQWLKVSATLPEDLSSVLHPNGNSQPYLTPVPTPVPGF